MRRVAICLVACSLISSCTKRDWQPDSVIAEISNGTLDVDDESVVALAVGREVYCSGTLIRPRVVVTAAHCIDGGSPDKVFFGQSTRKAGVFVDVTLRSIHPHFQQATLENDVGVLLLAEDAPAKPVDMLPPGSLGQNDVGEAIRIVGFGSGTTIVNKLEGESSIVAIDDKTFQHAAEPSHACFGDSGGPAFLTRDGRAFAIGIASAGDPDCADFGRYIRLDAYRDEFLDSFPEPTTKVGERCYDDGNCEDGECIAPLSVGAFPYCSLACAAQEDCPSGLSCMLDQSGERYCRPDVPTAGALGARCADASDCASGYCTSVEGSEHQVCALRCFAENEISCPDGFTCRGSSSGEDICVATNYDTARGCSVALRGTSTGRIPSGVACLMLLFAGQKRGRRRAIHAGRLHQPR